MANCASFRGQNLFSRNDASGKYVEMMGKEAMLYFPVNILPNVTYKVQVEMSKKSGNGIFHCNIYGNREYDFPQVKMVCEDNNWRVYSFNIETKSFPSTVPMVFRIWRNPDGLGSIYIRKITVELIGNNIDKNFCDNKFNNKENRIEDIEKEIGNLNVVSIPCFYSAGSLHKFTCKKPKKSDNAPDCDKIKISVVVSIFNRKNFFERSLISYAKQNFNKEDFEIVVVDDKSTDDIFGLCKHYNKKYGLQFQYILVDKNKGAIPPRSFNQSLTNNIGFKKSRGSVIVITGPETIQKETNLLYSWEKANQGYCVYGNIARSSVEFVNKIKIDDNWIKLSFEEMINLPGAKHELGQMAGFWWYFVAVRKEHIFNINGVDERYMLGITAEDDNFAFRMDASEVALIRDSRIEGIHQDHSSEDGFDLHSIRNDKKIWACLRNHNVQLLNDWHQFRDPIANKDIDWGSDNAIVKLEIL